MGAGTLAHLGVSTTCTNAIFVPAESNNNALFRDMIGRKVPFISRNLIHENILKEWTPQKMNV